MGRRREPELPVLVQAQVLLVQVQTQTAIASLESKYPVVIRGPQIKSYREYTLH